MTDWSRLSKLAGMLGSPHDGERLNAARLLDAALQRDGLTFGDLSQRIASGGHAPESPRTVIVEKWKPNPASALARKILRMGQARLSNTENVFLNGVVCDCEMSGSYSLTGMQLAWLKDLEKIYVLGTKRKAPRARRSGPVPGDVLDDVGLGAKPGRYTGEPEPRKPRERNTYRPQARSVDMPDGRDEVETRGNSAWAARKVDLDFDDDIPF